MREKSAVFYLQVAMVLGAVAQLHAGDLDTLQSRFESHVLGQRPSSSAASYLSSQSANGSWSDVNYADNSTASWDLYKHIDRTLQMAVAYRDPASTHYQSASMLAAIEKGLSYWNTTNPSTPNAYDRAIGAPMKLGEILVLTDGKIAGSVRDGTLTYMSRVVQPGGYSRYGNTQYETAADVARAAYVHMTIGMVTNDSAAISTASTRIQNEAKVRTKDNEEGLRPDGSYHYHGPQLYTPWYAQTHFDGTALWSRMVTSTQWQFGSGAQTFLRSGVLDGMQWMAYRGRWDPFVMGRAVAVKGTHTTDLNWVADLKVSDPAYATQYQAFIDHNSPNSTTASVVGSKFFSESDYLSHRRDGFMLSVRMISTRTENQETGNKQNIRNRWLSQGTTAILLKGDEYDNIYPVWDWKRIPGTTASNQSGSRLETGAWGLAGKTNFVGAASDGTNTVAAMDLRAPEATVSGVTAEVRGKKSWFMFNDVMIAMGAGINYNGSSNPITTTINQTTRRGKVISFNGNGATEEQDTTSTGKSLNGARWVWHDNVGYLFPSAQNVLLRSESNLTGDWSSISPGSYPSGTTETRNRFTLTIEHGNLTSTSSGSYAYMVVPGRTLSEFEQYVASTEIDILANTSSLAAVRDNVNELAGAIFYDVAQAGAAQLTDDLAFLPSQNLILLLDTSGAIPQVTLSSASGKTPGAENFGAITIYSEVVENILIGGQIYAPVERGADWVRFDLPAGVSEFQMTIVPEPAAGLFVPAAGMLLCGRRKPRRTVRV